jgi:biopolymer transport protein ExbD
MGNAYREDALLVSVTRDGKIYLGITYVDPHTLTDEIRKRLTEGAERKVYIKADARARYRVVAEVIDSAQRAGLEEIGLITQPQPNASAPRKQP